MKGDVYSQSKWLVLKTADMYFVKKRNQRDIASELHISEATVSRLVSRAKQEGIVQFVVPEKFSCCLDYGEMIRQRFGLRECVISLKAFMPSDWLEDDVKAAVALEGARYLQRIVTKSDLLGVAWGGTVSKLIQLLNPCQRVDIPFISLHGSIKDCDDRLDVNTLVSRMAMAFGGQDYSFHCSGLLDSERQFCEAMSSPRIQKVASLFPFVTISISGIGSFYPEITSPLSRESFLKLNELDELKSMNVYGDFMLRFIDKNGEELPSSLKNRTLAITLEQYKKIRRKIVVASGVQKTEAVLALLKGGLIDVLIIDEDLAVSILAEATQEV